MLAPRHSGSMKAVDPELRVHATRVLRTTNDHFYAGYQFKGQVTDFLRSRLKLTFLKPPDDLGRLVTTSMDWRLSRVGLAFIMQFKWDRSGGDVGQIRGEWIDGSGRVVSSTVCFFDSSGPLKYGVWKLCDARPGRYRLRLLKDVTAGAQRTNTECLAETRWIEYVSANGNTCP
jgi:hypothetical protein